VKRQRVALALVLSVAWPLIADAGEVWQGARLTKLERIADRPVPQVQALRHEGVAPSISPNGDLWLIAADGTVRVDMPYAGTRGHWRLPHGSDAEPVFAGTTGTAYVATRNGDLYRLRPGDPRAVTVATGLPHAVGSACADKNQRIYWPGRDGGVFMTGTEGQILDKVATDLFAEKRFRGGAAVHCFERSAVVAAGGGKVVRAEGNFLQWSKFLRGFENDDFAPHAAAIDDVVYLCGRAVTGRCVAVASENGRKIAEIAVGSWDGPMAHAGELWIVGRDATLYRADASLTIEREITVPSATPLWLARPPQDDGKPRAYVMALGTDGTIWRIGRDGDVGRVYTVPSGLGASGRMFFDGSLAVMSNGGSYHLFQVQ